jgi:hypothetical protein
MIEPKKRKVFSIQEKKDILAQVDANKETRVALAVRLGIAPYKQWNLFWFYINCC